MQPWKTPTVTEIMCTFHKDSTEGQECCNDGKICHYMEGTGQCAHASEEQKETPWTEYTYGGKLESLKRD